MVTGKGPDAVAALTLCCQINETDAAAAMSEVMVLRSLFLEQRFRWFALERLS